MLWQQLAELAWTGYLVVLALLCVYGLHRYFLVALFWRHRKRPTEPARCFDELPRVTVQLPMYNEPLVAQRVIERAGAIDYPADKLEIQVLDDSTDETVALARAAVAQLVARGIDAKHIHRTDRTGFKAGALQDATRSASGEFILIFDADFVPPPDILRRAIHHFTDPAIGLVQTRWDHLNRDLSILTRAQAVLLDGHFVIEHTARNRSGRFMSFNGTAGIWRKSAIDDAGGWQHDTLTEDLDLSYRAQLRGWRFVFMPELASPAELPPEMSAFKAQQYRWTKGGAQTLVKLLPLVLRSPVPWWVKLEAWFHLTSCLVYPLMVLLTLLIGPALISRLVVSMDDYPLWRFVFDFTLFVVGTSSALAFYIVSQIELRRPWHLTLAAIPPLLAVGIGIALNNAVATISGLFSRAGEFVRTPKFGDSTSAPRRRVHFRIGWQALTELGLAAYVALCLLALFFFDDWLERVSMAMPFLGLFIGGYAYVGWQTIRTVRGGPA